MQLANWWQSFYDDIVADIMLRRKDLSDVQATISFLAEHLALSPGDRAFDQCCGIGTLALALARCGHELVGVDQAGAYIEEARQQASRAGLAAEFFVGDGCTFVPARPCAGAFNWDTGFGNGDDASNIRMLRCAYDSLRPGGWFALDYQHIPRVLARFQTSLVSHHQDQQGETVIVRESQLDLAGGMLRQLWTLFLPDGRRVTRDSAVRLYLPHVLGAMLESCGFREVRYHGGVRGEPLTLDSPRCIVLARRPAP